MLGHAVSANSCQVRASMSNPCTRVHPCVPLPHGAEILSEAVELFKHHVTVTEVATDAMEE